MDMWVLSIALQGDWLNGVQWPFWQKTSTGHLKRARMSNGYDIEIDLSLCNRHLGLWLDDGSIVLNVESTLFRIHRTPCKHSKVFADMSAIPQPESGMQNIKGSPVVTIPDRADGSAYLPRAIYNPL